MPGTPIRLSNYGDDCRTIQRSCLKQLLSLDNDKIKIISNDPQHVNTFPPEIWMELFSFMDIKTLTLLRSVCKGFRELISNTPKYRLLYANVAHLIRASLLSGIASFVTLGQLHQAYISTKCSYNACDDDAEFIYLLGAARICVLHLHSIEVVNLNKGIIETFPSTSNALRRLPCIRPIFNKPTIDPYSDQKTIISLRQINASMAQRVDDLLQNLHPVNEGFVLKSCLMVPWLDSATKKNHWGYYCSSHTDKHYKSSRPAHYTYRRARLSRCCEDCYEAREKWKDYVDNDKGGEERITEREDDLASATNLVMSKD